MKITKVFPRGFCKGVVDAWITIEKFIKNNPNKKMYMIGWFVHNEFMVEKIKELGVLILDDSKKSRIEIVKELEYTENSVIIFSSHGSDFRAIELAIERGFQIIDTTCIYVTKIQEIVQQKIIEGKDVIFFGKKTHPESLSVKAIDVEKIYICENLEDVRNIFKIENKRWFFTNQTTIGLEEYSDLLKYLHSRQDLDIEIKNDICGATNERQNAVKELNNVDLLIVVGDNKSNNSNKLRETGEKIGINSILISDVSKLDAYLLDKKKHIAITSGASTPTWITNEVIKYVESKK